MFRKQLFDLMCRERYNGQTGTLLNHDNLFSYSCLTSVSPYLIIAIRSSPPPHAKVVPLIPIERTTSGLNIPIPNSSIHLFLSSTYAMDWSDGSVYGKKVGQNLTFVRPSFE